ncbi:sn-glycerol-3-phosphate ABC transporter permease UgpA [Tistrella mobilis]|uniref:sn-glycerol-3-phosphate ABC transporter permease UgpA n=1 Tax=Tistrella mobilis TaxID=171437 RepID=UPI00355816E8
MATRSLFRGRALPLALVAPQIAITLIFFVWPAAQALKQSMLIEDAFGFGSEFVWFENFESVLTDPGYHNAIAVTALFSIGVMLVSLSLGLLLSALVDGVTSRRVGAIYRAISVAPYAIAPAVAGALWFFIFNPTVGIVTHWLGLVGIDWNHVRNGDQALLLVILAAAWKQIAYNFVFFLAGLQSIPRSLIEAAAIDGAGPGRRFVSIVLPLLSPTAFFLMVVNLTYAFFDTFPVIHAVTQGGPGNATETLVYKVFRDGFIGLDLGRSAAQSVILMVVVAAMTVVQFRWVERKVHY